MAPSGPGVGSSFPAHDGGGDAPGARGALKGVILGGGSFGLAMACVLGRAGVPATLLVRSRADADAVNARGRHPKYLPDVDLPEGTRATADAAEALRGASFLVHCVPVQHSRARKIAKHVPPPGAPVLCTSKGIERKTLGLMCEILPAQLGEDRAYASPPALCAEIARAPRRAEAISAARRPARGPTAFRVFTSADVVGLEVGGAVKNVLALAAGMAEGLDLGTNASRATPGPRRCSAISAAMGGRASTIGAARGSTIMGLSGVGDTFGTCFGPLSRNRGTGLRLGRGERLDDILADLGEVADRSNADEPERRCGRASGGASLDGASSPRYAGESPTAAALRVDAYGAFAAALDAEFRACAASLAAAPAAAAAAAVAAPAHAEELRCAVVRCGFCDRPGPPRRAAAAALAHGLWDRRRGCWAGFGRAAAPRRAAACGGGAVAVVVRDADACDGPALGLRRRVASATLACPSSRGPAWRSPRGAGRG
ncbi:hypothetical protein JL721_6750 [Aureococcus anophagefferens]|nr:hypothetical protein JL721_6750 [Aureococcus anophagefferens]